MAALLVVGLLAALRPPVAIGSVQVSVSGVVQIAAIPLVGPVGAGLIGSLPVILARREPVKDIFNVAQRLMLILAGTGVYHLAGGHQLVSGESVDPLALGAQLGLASLAAGLTNALLLAGVLQLSSAGSLRVIVTNLLRQAIPDYGSYAVAAYLLIILWGPCGLGWVSAFFFLPSLFVIQWGLHQHAALWASRHEVLTPFVEALELRHPGSAEEARLVAGAANAIATRLGLSPQVVDEITTAARLRDVGMLALQGAPAAIVRRDHPEAARKVLGSIRFLKNPLDLIEAHHERMDGQGHPYGLTGARIPVGSRVLAVADTWGHLVTEGWPAAEAIDRCHAVAGESLDPLCVAALQRALERDQLPQVKPA